MFKTFDCTTHRDFGRRYFPISGNTLQEAIQENIDRILSCNRPNDCPYRLVGYRLEYAPGIFGGSGGVKVIMDCYERSHHERPVVAEAWNKATKEDLEADQDR